MIHRLVDRLADFLALAGAVLLCLIPALVPFHDQPIPSFYAEAAAIACGLLACLALARPGAQPLPWMSLGLAGLVVVLAAQVGLGRVAFPERSALAMLYCAWLALVVMAGARLRERFGLDRLVLCLQAALACGGFLLALSGLMQHFRIEVFGVRLLPEQLVGMVGQRNHFATLVSCGLWSVVFLVAGGRLRLVTGVLAAAPMLLALPLCGSRSVWAYALLALVLIMPLDRRQYDVRADRLVLGCLAVIALLVAVQWSTHGESGARMAVTLGGDANIGDTARLALLEYAWAMFRQWPLLGAGFGEFAWSALSLGPVVGTGIGSLIDAQSHNLAAQLLAETGLLGAVCILGPLALWLAAWARRLCRAVSGALSGEPYDPGDHWLGLVVLVALAHSMVEYPLWYAYLGGPVALLIGSGGQDFQEDSQAQPGISFSLRIWPSCVVAAIALGTLVLTLLMADYRRVAAWEREARQTTAAHQPVTAAQVQRLFELRESVFAWRIEPVVAALTTFEPGHPDQAAAAAAVTGRALHGQPVPALVAHQVALLAAAGQPEAALHLREAARIILGQVIPEPTR